MMPVDHVTATPDPSLSATVTHTAWQQVVEQIADLIGIDDAQPALLDAIHQVIAQLPAGKLTAPASDAIHESRQLAPARSTGASRSLSSRAPEATDSLALPRSTLAELERRAIIEALRANHGNKAKTARELGISLRTIYNKMERHGIVLTRQLVE